MSVTLIHNPLIFYLSDDIEYIYLHDEGSKPDDFDAQYQNFTKHDPVDMTLSWCTLHNKPERHYIKSSAPWQPNETLVVQGPRADGDSVVIDIGPAGDESQYAKKLGDNISYRSSSIAASRRPPPPPPHTKDGGAAAENWTAEQGDGIFYATGQGNDDKLFHNLRCGPEKITHGSYIMNVLLNEYRRFGFLKPADFTYKYYKGATELWPLPEDSHGFAALPQPEEVDLKVGHPIDRFGMEGSPFYGVFGMTFAQRALPPKNLNFLEMPFMQPLITEKQLTPDQLKAIDDKLAEGNINPVSLRLENSVDAYRVYKVLKPFKALQGPVEPWFEQIGRNNQVFVTDEELIKLYNDDLKAKFPNATPSSKTQYPPGAWWLCENGYLERLKWSKVQELYMDIHSIVQTKKQQAIHANVSFDVHKATRFAAFKVLTKAEGLEPHPALAL